MKIIKEGISNSTANSIREALYKAIEENVKEKDFGQIIFNMLNDKMYRSGEIFDFDIFLFYLKKYSQGFK